MGNDASRTNTSATHIGWYETSLQLPCILPDVGVDESLTMYSGLNSSAVLQSRSDSMRDNVPDFSNLLVTRMGSVSPVPNSFGLGALVISFIFELVLKGSQPQTRDVDYGMLRRVFGEEKASAVRDTIAEYVNRHHVYLRNEQRLLEELQRIEAQLSGHLTVLKNSLLYDGQMNSRGFKIWVNGAAFHLEMAIHEARLRRPTGRAYLDQVTELNVLINVYLRDLHRLLKRYKMYKISKTTITSYEFTDNLTIMIRRGCEIRNTEHPYICMIGRDGKNDPCGRSDLVEAYVNYMFTHYEPICGIRGHFQSVKSNVMFLIDQHQDFILPN